MSVRLAAGCALSRFQSVSVVPMIQCRPHGITNSTDFSVRVMKPVSRADPVARHDEVDALAGLDVEAAAAADHLLDLVGPDAGGVDDDPGPDLEVAAGLEVAGAHADHPLALAQEAGHLGAGGDVRAVGGGGPGDRDHQPGVVDLAVVVADRAGAASRSAGRARSGRPGAGTGAGAAARPCRTSRASPSRRTAPARRRRTAAPSRGAAGRGTAPAGPGAAPAG